MSMSSPPHYDNTFDAFYDEQARRRQSSQNSHMSTSSQPPSQPVVPVHVAPERPLMDEPHSLSRHDSNASLASKGRERSSSTFSNVRSSSTAGSEWRKESLPFDPESSSTLIATAQQHGQHGGTPLNQVAFANSMGNLMYGGGTPGQQNVYTPADQQQYNPGWNNAGPSNTNQQYNAYSGMQNQAFSPYSNQSVTSPPIPTGTSDGFDLNQQNFQQGGWGNEFMQNGDGQGGDMAWNQQGDGNNMDTMLNDDQMQELERIISHSSHPSREPSPVPFQQSSTSPDPTSIPNMYDPSPGSRSTSPFFQNIPSPFSPPASSTFQRSSQSPNPTSPFLNKAQSPPALIIPGQPSPTPSLPPIVTTTGDNTEPARPSSSQGVHMQTMGGPVGLGNASGGLQPPVDPALKGLTGMQGISPIAPNADGPMIYIQPSTPISGMKDGRGLFDAVLRAQAAQGAQNQQNANQNNQQAQPGSSGMQQQTSNPTNSTGAGVPTQGGVPFPQAGNSDWSQGMQTPWNGLRPIGNGRPRAKSDSQMMSPISGGNFDRQSALQVLGLAGKDNSAIGDDDLNQAIDQWRMSSMFAGNQQGAQQGPAPTLDPRNLPGIENSGENMQNYDFSQQLAALQAQRDRLPALNMGGFNQDQPLDPKAPGEISPTSMAFYQQLGIAPNQPSDVLGTASAPYYQSNFQSVPQGTYPNTAAPGMQSFLAPDSAGLGPRRRSFAEGSAHPASGAGTPGYGMGFANQQAPAYLRPTSASGHRRGVKSEDWGRGGTGWGMGQGGSTAEFLNSITANDGTLLPPSRGRSHSRHSSGSSIRSASPALSISSQGSSYGGSPRMDMPDGAYLPVKERSPGRIAKLKVTSSATEMASSSRRTNEGVFRCPVPGCGSTFTRHFNLKGHLRSHNDERPYKCLFDGCPKSIVGFARQHDCKRHMLLHEGLRPFECEGCGKKFARLDALTRHHKSEQGQECAITHPLPVNPDGSPMSESQYKAYKAAERKSQGGGGGGGGGARGGRGIKQEFSGEIKEESLMPGWSMDDDIGTGSGMEDYDIQ